MQQTDQAAADQLVGNAHGDLARVKEILEEHPDLLDAKATWDETAIQAATQMGSRPIIEFLIERGAQVDFFTALVLGRVDDVDAGQASSRGIHDLPALYFAAIGGNVAVARRVLAAGADVNAGAQAASPIHGAVMGKNVEMVKLLLDHGADAAAKDYAGRDARDLALAVNRPDIAELFT
jgi:ankyrin repeat protein